MDAPVLASLVTSAAALLTSFYTGISNTRSKIKEQRADYLNRKLSRLEEAFELLHSRSAKSIDASTAFKDAISASEDEEKNKIAWSEYERVSIANSLIDTMEAFPILVKVKAYLPTDEFKDLEATFSRWSSDTMKGINEAVKGGYSKTTGADVPLSEASDLWARMHDLLDREIVLTVHDIEVNFSIARRHTKANH